MKAGYALRKCLPALVSLAILLTCLFPCGAASAMEHEPKLNFKYLSAVRKTSYKLNVYNMQPEYTAEFSSDNTRVVAIRRARTKSCRLKAKASGSAIVTVEISDAEGSVVTRLECRVSVSPLAVSIKFTKHKIRLAPGDTRTVRAVIKPSISAEQPKYISDDAGIAAVSSTGVVTAVSEGQTTIRAFLSNNKSASYTVIVEPDKDKEPASPEPRGMDGEPEPSPAPPSRFNAKSIAEE